MKATFGWLLFWAVLYDTMRWRRVDGYPIHAFNQSMRYHGAIVT